MPRQLGGGAHIPWHQLMLLTLASCSANVLALPSPAVDQKILRPIKPDSDPLPLQQQQQQQQRKLNGRFLHITGASRLLFPVCYWHPMHTIRNKEERVE